MGRICRLQVCIPSEHVAVQGWTAVITEKNQNSIKAQGDADADGGEGHWPQLEAAQQTRTHTAEEQCYVGQFVILLH